MTVLQLKRSMDARFLRVDQSFDGIDQRFDRIDQRFDRIDQRFDRLEREAQDREERLKRHFEVIVESLHDDMRMFAEAIGSQSDRLGDHETRLRKLERLT